MYVKCPKCGQLLTAEPGAVGTCPKCNTRVVCPKEDPEKNVVDATQRQITQTKSNESGLLVLSILFFITSGYFLFQAYDKITNYRNADFSSVNAYVGGDAYNYIINGTYSTTYVVIALIFVVCAFGCLILRAIKRK